MPGDRDFARRGPVILSVPHAGRDYPPALDEALRVPAAALQLLEDRFVDMVARAARDRQPTLIQTVPRAWIDLNRSEQERDPKVDAGADWTTQPRASAKLRSGLGLVPRRTGAAGDLWRRRFSGAEVEARIVADHRPYHAALAGLLEGARERFGVAVLLDLHSMPPLGTGEGARVVLGDRFGKAAGARFVARAEEEVRRCGVPVAINTPYAGAHILERHGAPARGIHAIQLELDRSLYLDAALDQPGPGFGETAALVARVLSALADEALSAACQMAAE